MSWYCLGHISGEGRGAICLDIANPKYGIHKPTCWSRKYKSLERDLLSRPENECLELLKQIGWKNDTIHGVAVDCDCGYKTYKKES